MDALQEVERYNGMTEELQQIEGGGVVEWRGVRWWWEEEGSVAEGKAFAETSDTW
jgi:hypothetical protein